MKSAPTPEQERHAQSVLDRSEEIYKHLFNDDRRKADYLDKTMGPDITNATPKEALRTLALVIAILEAS